MHTPLISHFQICDSNGYPFYARSFIEIEPLNEVLMSGLISALGIIGKRIFGQTVASVQFETANQISNIIVITKELFSEKKNIYFVYFTQETCSHKVLDEIATSIFIEMKGVLKSESIQESTLKPRIDHILNTRFNNLLTCIEK